MTMGLENLSIEKADTPSRLELLAKEFPEKCIDIQQLDSPIALEFSTKDAETLQESMSSTEGTPDTFNKETEEPLLDKRVNLTSETPSNQVDNNSSETTDSKSDQREVRASQIEANREAGADREKLALEILKKEYPEDEGYTIEREQYLRDENGNIVKDPETNEARRIDFLVVKDGQVVKSIEVTSETAPKDAQMAKEERIREAGGNFIKNKETGLLIEIPSEVQTQVRRYP